MSFKTSLPQKNLLWNWKIWKPKNLLEVFGSALYREKMPNGRYKYALNAQQLAEAVKTLKELQREGRLRRKKVNERIERFYNDLTLKSTSE